MVTGTFLMGIELDLVGLQRHFRQTEVQTKSYLDKSYMAQFISIVDSYSNPSERGRFRCELPSMANSSVNQIFDADICESLL